MIAVAMPDTGPLISLARIGRLDLIDRFKSQILITDAVQVELMDGPQDAPDLAVLTEWIAKGENRIRVVETTYGALLKQNRELLQFVPEGERARFRRRAMSSTAAARKAGRTSKTATIVPEGMASFALGDAPPAG